MNRVVVLLSLLMSVAQMVGQNKVDLSSDKALTQVFNEIEIEGLEAMAKYVDEMVLNSGNNTDADEAYHLYFEEIAHSKEYIIPFIEEEKYKFLESLDSIQFSTVWRFSDFVNLINTRDTIYRNLENFISLDIKPFSKYMDYLKEVGKEDIYFKYLQQEFEDVGNLTQDTAEWFPKNHTNFDFNTPKNRLWAAIYILKREETTEMKLDRYLKNQ